MEAEVKAQHPDANVTLRPGSGGVFDVKCDGKLIYSKHSKQRFPNEGEITELIGQGRK